MGLLALFFYFCSFIIVTNNFFFLPLILCFVFFFQVINPLTKYPFCQNYLAYESFKICHGLIKCSNPFSLAFLNSNKYALLMNPLARSLEELLPDRISSSYWCFMLLRTTLVASTVCVAFLVPFFGKFETLYLLVH